MSREPAFASSILVAVALVLAGSALAYQEVPVTDGGTITGSVKFVGPIPELEPIMVAKNQDTCGNTVPSEVLIVNPQNRGLKNAVVFLEKVEKGKRLKAKTSTLENAKCLFVPHVLVVPVREKLEVKNSDAILHNTHAFLGRRTVFNLALPVQGQVIKRKIKRPGVIKVRCDAHVHMSAWIMAIRHPYFAVTDHNGAYEIADVPPGKYKVIAWHEPWKVKVKEEGGRLLYEPVGGVTLAQEATISPKGEVKVSFEFK